MNSMGTNSIVKRRVLFMKVQFVSPLNLSSGEDEWTDADVLRDGRGDPFVPGSSIAGAIRAYIEKEKNCPCFMGYSAGGSQGKMSSLSVSDLNFDKNVVIGIRDGVALDDNKRTITGSKYDMEILEAGARGHFYLELAVREEDDEAEMERELASIFRGIDLGEIRLGSKKTRGFGKFKITFAAEKIYGRDNYLKYADAYEDGLWENEPNEWDRWVQKAEEENRMVRLEIPLKLEGGISIRRYAAKKNEPDFVHLTDHGVPVIPGSSFAGAIRHRTKQIWKELEEAGMEAPISAAEAVNRAFGFVDGTNACSSAIIISEAEIAGARPLTMVRTGISRFEAAVKDGALYKEKTYVDGTVNLEILVRKQKDPRDTKWIVGLLLLTLRDLQNGFLAVGGQTAIGRGVFFSNGAVKVDGEEDRADEYIAEIITGLKRGGDRYEA